jgi:hypothetical protein
VAVRKLEGDKVQGRIEEKGSHRKYPGQAMGQF